MTLVKALLVAFSATCSLAVMMVLGHLLIMRTFDIAALGVAALCVMGMGAALATGVLLLTPAGEPMRRRILRIVGDLI
jgi:hypothetical protein